MAAALHCIENIQTAQLWRAGPNSCHSRERLFVVSTAPPLKGTREMLSSNCYGHKCKEQSPCIARDACLKLADAGSDVVPQHHVDSPGQHGRAFPSNDACERQQEIFQTCLISMFHPPILINKKVFFL